jgi:sigma-E factor negative regulatory protein RseA
MSEQLHDQISAFVDGELPEQETELLLRRVEREPELKATLARYIAIGASMRSESRNRIANRLVSRVSAVIVAEAAQTHQPRQRVRVSSRWLRPVAGFAVAATVATVAILGIQRMQAGDEATGQVITAQNPRDIIGMPASQDDAESYVVPPDRGQASMAPAARLTNYVVAHSEYSSPLGRRNVLSGIIAEDPTALEESATTPAPAATVP